MKAPFVMLITSNGSKLKGLAHVNDSTTHCVYRIVNFRNGKAYIGQTKYEQHRYEQHFEMLLKESHHSKKLQRAYKKYGDSAFFFEVIERDVSPDIIHERECYWIAYYDSFTNGYNMNPGGDNGGNYKPFVLNGIAYESKKAACAAVGITPSDLARAIKRKKQQMEENKQPK